MRVFFAYLRRHVRQIMMLALFSCVFAVVMWLHQLPAEAVLYAALLCAAVGLIFFFYGLYRFREKHERLRKIGDHLEDGLDALPPPLDLIEEDYQHILRTFFSDRQDKDAWAEARRHSQNTYFTLWAHQIKTPISAMRLLVQSEGIGPADELTDSLFAVEQYVELALQYLRMESMTSDLVIRRCSLEDMVRQAVRKYARQFIYKKIALDLRPIDNLVLTDEKWLVFVIEQLLSNALKYTPSGSITIYSEPGDILVIEDTGIGIRSEDLPRVFERGYTGLNGREDKRSTGIGLYLCREVLQKLSHGITIDSKVGHGTRVRVDLRSAQVEIE